MFGCIKKFFMLIIIIFAVIGFVAIGGVTFFNEFFHNPWAQPQIHKMKKAAEIADFTNLDEEFEIVSSSKIPKIGNYVYIKHGATSQRFYFSKPTNPETLTKKDFSTKECDVKIVKFVQDFKFLQLENFEISGRGSMYALGQTIPYIKFKSDVVNLPIKGIHGIVGVASHGNDNIIIVSSNASGKYSQIVTDALMKQLKVSKDSK